MPAGVWVNQLQEKLEALELAGARINVSPPRDYRVSVQTLQEPTSRLALSVMMWLHLI
jgi:hypothetical protein